MEKLITKKELCATIGVPERTFDNWRSRGVSTPRATKVGRRVMFSPTDVRAWLEQHKEPAA